MRLIDADTIEYTHAIARCIEYGHNWNELCVTKDEIDDMPTIDAIEVVRCEDCKYFSDPNSYIGKCTLRGDYIVPNDFCSYAEERRTDDCIRIINAE